MSTAFAITSFRTVPYALLQRDLRFKRLAAFEGGQQVVLAAASVLLALAGFRYWTLVIANVLGAAISTGLVLLQHRQPFARPRRDSIQEALTFSRHTLVNRVSFYWYSNADYLVAGKLLGQAAYGAYQLAYSLPLALLDRTSGLVLRVTPAVFSSVKHDPAALRRYFVGITEGLALITFPLTIGMALVAEDFVNAALGERWRLMIVPLQLLAGYAAFRSLIPLVGQLLVATGRNALDARNSVEMAVVLPIAFLVGSRWGIVGIAAAWIVAHPFFGLRLIYRACERIELPVRRYVVALLPAATSALMMAAALVVLRRLVPEGWPIALRLAVEVAGGALAYALALLLLHRGRLLAFRQLWKSIRA
jgi:PST family polysaccharide transporter